MSSQENFTDKCSLILTEIKNVEDEPSSEVRDYKIFQLRKQRASLLNKSWYMPYVMIPVEKDCCDNYLSFITHKGQPHQCIHIIMLAPEPNYTDGVYMVPYRVYYSKDLEKFWDGYAWFNDNNTIYTRIKPDFGWVNDMTFMLEGTEIPPIKLECSYNTIN